MRGAAGMRMSAGLACCTRACFPLPKIQLVQNFSQLEMLRQGCSTTRAAWLALVEQLLQRSCSGQFASMVLPVAILVGAPTGKKIGLHVDS